MTRRFLGYIIAMFHHIISIGIHFMCKGTLTSSSKPGMVNVEPRKVVRWGDSLGITLPPKFVKDNGLEAGDIVGLVFSKGLMKLVTMPETRAENQSVTDV